MKTLAIVGAMTFVVQAAFAQNMPPNEGNLPSLRTPTPLRAQIDRNISPSFRTSSQANRDEDVAKVVPVKCKKPTGKFPWNFDKVKVTDIVDQISRLTCHNFIISSAVKPTQDMTIISRTPVDVDQAWQAFLSALESNDLALVKVGSYYKIIKRTDSIKQNIPLYEKGQSLPDNEGMITLLYDVRNISKEIAQSLVKGLISKSGEVLVVGEAYLVISDGSSNIRRVMRILEKVDIPGAANRIHIIDLAHASSTEIKTKIDEIFDAKSSTDRNRMLSAAARADRIRSGLADTGTGSESFSVQKIIADERTNKLIVIASDKAYGRIKEVIDLLDVPSSDSSSQGQINVYYLKNGDAKKLAATLSSLVQGTQNAARSGGAARPAVFRAEQEGVLFEGEIKITADEATNSLVVIGSPRDYKAISQVIAKLDKQRTQVYVEAAIMDVSVKDTNDFGVSAYSGLKLPAIPGVMPDGGLAVVGNPGGQDLAAKVVGSTVSAITSTGAGAANASLAGIPHFLGQSNLFGLLGLAPIPLPGGGSGVSIPSLGVILKALQESRDVDVLSTPSLMTLDNEKAEISVGENIPTASGISTVGTSGTAALIPLQQVTRLDVKLKFGITPHVNDSDAVRLEIDQDVNELGDVVVIQGSNNFSIRNKSAKTVVVAKDQQTVVIGGLISNRTTTSETKTPWLGDIPVLGHLFKSTHKEKEKKNLVLVLTPYIIRDDDDLKKIYDRKMKDREDFGKLYFGNKISRYDPQVDYDKKTGPLANVVRKVELGMMKVENGGPGLPGETVVKPEKQQETEHRRLDITVPDASPAPTPAVPFQQMRPELEELDEDFIDDSEPPRNNDSGMMPPGTPAPPVEAPPPPAPPPG